MKKYFFLLALCWPLFIAAAQDRGLVASALKAVGNDAAIGKQWAVFIAIDKYREWPPLNNPIRDANEIRDILTEFYFIDEIVELYDANATASGIRRLFGDLRSKTGMDDSVFVFYAGHGHTDSLTQTGSWIPVDGGKDQLAQANWLPNIQIRNMLSALPAKHVFLVSDACFSGDILDTSRGASPELSNDYYKKVYSKVSRQVLTSGASEQVPDASEFALRFKSILRRASGLCIDPEYIFTAVREVKSTQPLLGIIKSSEHQEGGSFLFFRKETASADVNRGGTAVSVTVQERDPPSENVRSTPQGFIFIQGGSFMMGSANRENGRREDEYRHQVTIGNFFIAKYEVTQKEYEDLMGNNPSKYNSNPQNPVDSTTWYDAIEYCNRRSAAEGLTPAYYINGKTVSWNKNSKGYRLPTEAEWEYACRAGTETAYNTGNEISNFLAAFKIHASCAVGSFPANNWGLYDMHGNAGEWCWDWYGEFSSKSEINPIGPATGFKKVQRGGTWKDQNINLRSAKRTSAYPNSKADTTGFRVARNSEN